MQYKMLVLDLDGTALMKNGQVHPADIEAARTLADAGVHVTISTGRLYSGTRSAARALGVRGTVSVMNGTELIDAQTHEVHHGRYMPHSDREAIRELLTTHGVNPFLFDSEDIHIPHDAEEHAPYLGVWTDTLHRHADIFTAGAWTHESLVAICGVAMHDDIAAFASQIRAQLPSVRPTTFTTFRGHGFVELRADGDDKGTALERLAEQRSIGADEVIAVGDWLNDLPMLERAGLSFAMAESAPEAVEAADESLESVRGEGGAVAELAQRIWGL